MECSVRAAMPGMPLPLLQASGAHSGANSHAVCAALVPPAGSHAPPLGWGHPPAPRGRAPPAQTGRGRRAGGRGARGRCNNGARGRTGMETWACWQDAAPEGRLRWRAGVVLLPLLAPPSIATFAGVAGSSPRHACLWITPPRFRLATRSSLVAAAPAGRSKQTALGASRAASRPRRQARCPYQPHNMHVGEQRVAHRAPSCARRGAGATGWAEARAGSCRRRVPVL